MHSILPHQHHEEIGSTEHTEEHAEANDFLDYVFLMFHVDLGEGHMENFESGVEYDLSVEYNVNVFPDLITHQYYPLLLPEVDDSQSSKILVYEVPIVNRYVSNNLNLRGPPSFV